METSACRDGTLKNQIGTTPQHFLTIPTSCAILPTVPCVCCTWEAQWEVGSGGYAAHGFVCMESEVVCGWLQHTSLLLIMAATVLYVKSVE